MKTYKVKSIDWRDDDDNACEFSSFDAEDAVNDWCKHMDSNSNFIDGYPDNHEVEVIHEDGTRTRYTVSTEWSPDFYVCAKVPA